jgi:uncharacterized ion transporter superfamily protein YfcC
LKNFKIPHVFIFLSLIILIGSLLTYFVPSGEYLRTKRQVGNIEQTIVEPGSYRQLPKHFSPFGVLIGEQLPGKATPVSLLGLITAIPKGLTSAASLIFFIFIIGAVLNLIRYSGTISVFLQLLLNKFRHRPALLTFLLFLFLALAASFLGMGYEFIIPLIPLFIIIARQMGYDRVYGVAILILGSGTGWATAITNPFNLQIAQQVAELPIGSGAAFRVVFFLVCAAISFTYLWQYGKKIKKNSNDALVPFEDDDNKNDDFKAEVEPMTTRHIWIGVMAVTLFAAILTAVQTLGWSLAEMTGGFLTVGIITILLSGMSGSEAMKVFVKGLEMMVIPALVVGVARAIQVVLEEGQIIDTFLFYSASFLESQPRILSVQGMYVFQTFLNFFIPSASGQALVSMPLMVPLSDLLGISRQTAVFAFTTGDGFSNMIIPTFGVLMAILSIAKVPYEKWFRFVWPVYLMLAAAAALFLGIALLINY